MTALNSAILDLRSGNCEAAVVAAGQLLLNPVTSALFNKMGALSPEGACKSFDASGEKLYIMLFNLIIFLAL